MNHSKEFVLESKPKVIHFFLHLLTELLSKKLGQSYCLPRFVVGLLGCYTGWEITFFPPGVHNRADNARPTCKKPPTLVSSAKILHKTVKCFSTHYLLWFSYQFHFHEGLRVREVEILRIHMQIIRFQVQEPFPWTMNDSPNQSAEEGLNSAVLTYNSKEPNSEAY